MSGVKNLYKDKILCVSFMAVFTGAFGALFLANHIGMAKSLHYPAIKEYRYWDYEKRCVDLQGMLEDLRVNGCDMILSCERVLLHCVNYTVTCLKCLNS